MLFPLARRLLLAAVLPSLMAGGPLVPSALAQSTESLTIAVLDLDRILREADAAKSLREEIEASRSAFQAELRQEEQALSEADQELARQRAVLSAEAFAEKRKELEQRAAQLQRDFVSRQRELERSFAEGLAEVRRALIDVSKEIALEQGIDIILQKASVMLASRDLDITGEALKRLNEKLPDVSLPVTQN